MSSDYIQGTPKKKETKPKTPFSSGSKKYKNKETLMNEILKLEGIVNKTRPDKYSGKLLRKEMMEYIDELRNAANFQVQLDQRKQALLQKDAHLKQKEALKSGKEKVLSGLKRMIQEQKEQQKKLDETQNKRIEKQNEEQDKYIEKLKRQELAVQTLKDELFAQSVLRTKIAEDGSMVEDAPYIKDINQTRSTTTIGASPMGISRRLKSGEFTTNQLKKYSYKLR